MRRTKWLSLISLVALLIVVTAIPAFAGKPEFDTIELDGSEYYGSCDGFDVILSSTGAIKYSLRSTAQGTTVEITRYRVVNTWTNSITSKSFSSPNVGVDKLTIYPDGSATLAVIGLYNRLVVPGQGVAAIEAGKVVLFFSDPDDSDPDVVFEAGQHSGDEFFPILCGLLAE